MIYVIEVSSIDVLLSFTNHICSGTVVDLTEKIVWYLFILGDKQDLKCMKF